MPKDGDTRGSRQREMTERINGRN